MWRMQEVLFRMSLKSEPTSTVRDLDQGHVIPNMAPPDWRGIWYPKGFDTDIRDERSGSVDNFPAEHRSEVSFRRILVTIKASAQIYAQVGIFMSWRKTHYFRLSEV